MDQSPIPHTQPQTLMSFAEAINELLDGQRITKLEWNNQEIYGVLVEGQLRLHKSDGKFYAWTISEADLAGKDYAVLMLI
jgi:hypothetical protein